MKRSERLPYDPKGPISDFFDFLSSRLGENKFIKIVKDRIEYEEKRDKDDENKADASAMKKLKAILFYLDLIEKIIVDDGDDGIDFKEYIFGGGGERSQRRFFNASQLLAIKIIFRLDGQSSVGSARELAERVGSEGRTKQARSSGRALIRALKSKLELICQSDFDLDILSDDEKKVIETLFREYQRDFTMLDNIINNIVKKRRIAPKTTESAKASLCLHFKKMQVKAMKIIYGLDNELPADSFADLARRMGSEATDNNSLGSGGRYTANAILSKLKSIIEGNFSIDEIEEPVKSLLERIFEKYSRNYEKLEYPVKMISRGWRLNSNK